MDKGDGNSRVAEVAEGRAGGSMQVRQQMVDGTKSGIGTGRRERNWRVEGVAELGRCGQ